MTRARTHLRRQNGRTLLGQLRDFFRENPHEELSAEDVAAKYDCAEAYAQACLGQLAGEGVLRRVSVYVAGPRIEDAA